MDNPFEENGRGDEDEVLSDGESEDVKALMKAQLEVSPLVPPVPPMPWESEQAKHGPHLAISSANQGSRPLLLKKRKYEDDSVTEQDFHDIVSPTRPATKRPSIHSSENPVVAALHEQPTVAASSEHHQINPVAPTFPLNTASVPLSQGSTMAGAPPVMGPPPVIAPPMARMSGTIAEHPLAVLPSQPAAYPAQEPMIAPGSVDKASQEPNLLTGESSLIALAPPPSIEGSSKQPDSSLQAGDIFDDAEDGAQMPLEQHLASPPVVRSEPSILSPSRPVEHDGDSPKKDRRMDLVAIVTGARSPSKPAHQEPVDSKPKSSSVNEAVEAPQQKESQNEKDSATKQTDETKKRGKKKVPQPKSRVLVGKKERDAAKVALADKLDLLTYLPPEDCRFLAEKLWVFTERQLLRILESSVDVNESVRSSESDERIKIDRVTLAHKLAEKFFLERKPVYKGPDQNANQESEKSPDDKTKDTLLQNEKQPGVDVVSGQAGEADAKTNNLVTTGNSNGNDSESVKNPFNIASSVPAPGSTEENLGVDAPQDFPYSVFRPEPETWIKDASSFKGRSEGSEVSPVLSITGEDQSRAESKMNEWYELLRKKSEPANVPLDSIFPLDGPIAILLPVPTRNFLASVKITSLYQFLSLRKTETGAIIDMLRLWREQNGLSKLHNIALAKHLLGVMYRLEAALESDFPLNPRTQKWINDPMVIMTGAAKDFLIDHLSLLSAKEFLECRTKDLADKLVEWRISKGMVPLKGSGKVAMISSWKACAREELEIQSEDGKILEDVDLLSLSSRGIPIVADETEYVPVAQKPKPKPKPAAAAKSTRKQPKSLQSNLQVDYASHSRLFVEHVLGKEIADFLSNVGVGTADELQKADTSEDSTLCQQIMAAKMAEDYSGCQRKVDEWRSRLQQQLKDMSSEDSTQKPISSETPSVAKTKSSAPLDQIKFAEPYEALSSVTKRFLTSIGIRTGEEFLSARTTDIAADFVKWRIKEGKPELKGLGAIASVSGWKAQCRKAARDMGMEDIATLEPGNRSSWGASRSKKSTSPKADQSTRLKFSLPTLPHAIAATVRKANVLSGNSSAEVVVQADQGSNRRFFFELSLRKADDSDPIGLFITYKGANPSGDASISSSVKTIVLVEKMYTKPKAALPVLLDVPGIRQHAHSQFDERAPFRCDSSDYGLIDLSAYGVLPVERQDLGELKEVIRCFVFGETPGTAMLVDPLSSRAANVLVERNSLGHRYYLHLTKTLERGQACQLLFPSASDQLRGGTDHYDLKKHGSRPIIEDALLVLSQDDLTDLLNWMKDTLLVAGGLKDIQNESGILLCKNYEARRRLHWVSRLCLTLLKTASDQSEEAGELLYFGPDSLEKAEGEEKMELFTKEVSQELLHSLTNDPVCGDHMCIWFCNIARKMLDACVSELVDCYQLPTENSATIFSQKMNALIGSFLDVEERFKKGSIDLSDLCQRIPDDPLFNDVPEGQKIRDPEPKIACECVGRPLGVTFREKTEALDKEVNLAFDWYQELLAGIGFSTLHAFDKLLDEREKTRFDISGVLDAIKAASPFPRRHITSRLLSKECVKIGRQTLSSIHMATVVPGSRQFFLGIVWPALREQGWRLEGGDSPEDVVYFPPKTSQRKRSALLKQEGNRKRMRLSREIDKLGWGSVKKLTKRLVAAVAADLSQEDAPFFESSSLSVRDATGALVEWVQKSLDCDDDGACTERVDSIALAVRELFDELAPFMNDGAGWPSLEDSTEPSVKYRAEHMLQFLLVLPGILRQSDLSLQEISDTFQVIQDLTDMFASNYEELLDGRFHPPVEKYNAEGAEEKSILAERLKLLKPLKPPPSAASTDAATSTSAEDASELTEAILDEDKGELTDFVVRVMEQFVPCRATDRDAEKKFRRIHVGFPGLICRHCLAERGEGRYFFSTIESLTTASTVLEKHVLKCQSMPENVKTDVVNARITHAAQRKMLENGSQQAYFNRLWDRLRSSKIGGKAMNVPMPATGNKDLKASGTEGVLTEATLEFRDHIEILDHVRTHAPWKSNRSVQASLGKYYSCLDYGGRIYQTPSMPERFSSEWLLAKICPKKYENTKGKSLPG